MDNPPKIPRIRLSRYYKKCVVCDKRRLPKSNVFLAKFPMDVNRCRLWVKNIGIEDLAYVPIEKLHELKYVCGSHFAQECFNKKGNRLLDTAVPTLELNNPPLLDHVMVNFPLHTMESQRQNIQLPVLRDVSNAQKKTVEVATKLSDTENIPPKDQMELDYEPIATTSKAPQHLTFKKNIDKLKKPEIENASSPIEVTIAPKLSNQNLEENLITDKIVVQSYERKKESRMEKGTLILTKREKRLIKQLQDTKTTLRRIARTAVNLDNIDSDVLKSIVLNAAKNQSKKPHGKRWDLKNKVLALSIFKRSPKTYRYMQKVMPLPSTKTLQRLLKNMPMEPGIYTRIMNALKTKATVMDPADRYCTLTFDEIALKKRLIYNEISDKIEGYVDLGPGEDMGRKDQVADHALVFMVQGIRRKFKQPVAHYFVAGTIATEKLAALIKRVIVALREAGYTVITTVCDQGPTNVGALNLLKRLSGQPTEEHFFYCDEHKIFIMYDIPHLFKSIRNNFFNGGIIKLNNKTAKWVHLKEAEERNRNFLDFPKLTATVVNPTYKIKMRVKYAAHALSNTTAAVLKMLACCTSNEINSSEMMQSAEVIKELDQLFDCTNGPASPHDVKKGKRENVSKKTNHIDLWNHYLQIMDTVEFLNKETLRPLKNVRCVKGYIISLKSLKGIWQKLEGEANFKYLNLRQLNQDCLENLFGLIRQHSATNKNPTCTHFTAALKSGIISGLIAPHSRGANCEDDTNKLLLGYNEISSKDDHESETEEVPPFELNQSYPVLSIPEDTDFSKYEEDLSSFENQPVVYVSGYLAAKLISTSSCNECIKSLKIDEPGHDQAYTYISLREWWNEEKSLTYPTKKLYLYVNDAMNLFKSNVSNCMYFDNICHWYGVQLSTLSMDWLKCQEHLIQVTAQLNKKLSLLFIRKYCKNKNMQYEHVEQEVEDKKKKLQQQGKEK